MRLFELSSPTLLALALARGVLAQCSTLFHGATIIAFGEESSKPNVLRNSSLLVINDRIAGLFENNSIDELPTGTEVTDATGRIISPGFIDTYHHLWQTAYKTIASNTTHAQYFQRYGDFGPAAQHFSPDDIRVGQLAGCLELLYVGTITVVDHAYADFSNETMDAALDATLESGIRSFFAPAIHELGNGYSIEDQRYKLLSLVDDPRLDNATVTLGLAYDRFYMASQIEVGSFWNIVR